MSLVFAGAHIVYRGQTMSGDWFSTMCGLGTKFRLSGWWQAPLSAHAPDLVTFVEFLFIFVTHQSVAGSACFLLLCSLLHLDW